MDVAIIQDRILPLEEVPPAYLDRAMFFGDGVYEVLRSYQGKIFALEEHLGRFANSLAAIGIDDVSINEVRERVLTAFAEADIPDAKVYFHITRGAALRDLYMEGPLQSNFFLTVTELPDSTREKQQGIAVATHPDWRWKRCDIKSLNLLPNVLARRDALAKGCMESILVDDNGLISEGAGSAFFAVFKADGSSWIIRTAPLTANILPSVTRMFVLQAAEALGLTVQEVSFTPQEALDAAELFMAVTTKDIVPVVTFDGHVIGQGRPGSITKALMEAFKTFTSV
jgi:D-alanine transaminase